MSVCMCVCVCVCVCVRVRAALNERHERAASAVAPASAVGSARPPPKSGGTLPVCEGVSCKILLAEAVSSSRLARGSMDRVDRDPVDRDRQPLTVAPSSTVNAKPPKFVRFASAPFDARRTGSLDDPRGDGAFARRNRGSAPKVRGLGERGG